MKIVTDLDILRQKSKDVPERIDSYYKLINDLEQALEECPKNGAGLSAIQIGVPLRVAIIRTKTLKLDLFNTEILEASDLKEFKGEGCLSIPDKFVTTLRMDKIKIKNGDGKLYILNGFDAVVVQHEMDHWDGILILDREIKQGGI